MLIKYVIFGLLIILSIFLIYKFYRSYKEFDIERDKLYEFLCTLDDNEALKYLGFINFMGVQEKVWVSTQKMKQYLEIRPELMKKDEVIEFSKKMDLFNKRFIKYWCSTMILLFCAFNFCLN